MERTEDLNRMNRALDCEAHNLPIPDDCIVQHNDISYYPYEYIMTGDGNGNFVHLAMLHSLNSNSVIRVPLEQVKEYTP